MPLLVMKSYPATLLRTRRAGWRSAGSGKYARRARGCPGISESAFNLTDRHGNYQYRRSAAGPRLKRGLADDLVVAPYATALAAMVAPAPRAVANSGGWRARASTAATATTSPSLHAAQDVRSDSGRGRAGARGWW